MVTTYKGFTQVSGRIALDEFFTRISGPTYERMVGKINWLTAGGSLQEAGNVKRQLPFFTITAGYDERRLPASITGYNDLITIDIDKLSDEQVAALRPLIEQDPATVGCFLTVSRHGFKIIACLDSPQARELREAYLQTEQISYERLEEYHGKMYELTRRYYEQLLDVQVDTSGKDISRGVFASFDPDAFLSAERLERVCPVTAKIIPGKPTGRRKAAVSASGASTHPEAPAGGMEPDTFNPVTLMEFNRCVAAVQRIVRYTEGSYNSFLFTLGNKCFTRGLDEGEVKRLAACRYGDGGKWDTDTPIANGYTYVSKTEQAEKKKTTRQPAIEQVIAFLNERYAFRRNTLLERLEFRELAPGFTDLDFRPVAAKDLNTIFNRMSLEGISYTQTNLRAVIDSDHARPFDPVESYFGSLPRWDGTTDYIGRLADTVRAADQDYWRRAFRSWLVAMVACAQGTQDINQQTLLLHGEQGKGKSTWIRNLLPPELREYYRNGMINPESKDDMMFLATRLVINMEEFEGMRIEEIPSLKRIISQEGIIVRKPYDVQPIMYPRRASFIGSTNNTRFLGDTGGSRRFLAVHVDEIDYRAKVDYAGVYSQALYLSGNGYRYWFEGEEIKEINHRNETHRMKDPVEENLYVYYRPATLQDKKIKWKPASSILSYLSIFGKTPANAQTHQLLVQILERDGFLKRVNDQGITEYAVLELTETEREEMSSK